METFDDWTTVSQLATESGLSRAFIQQRCKSGEIPAEFRPLPWPPGSKPIWWIKRADAEAWIANRGEVTSLGTHAPRMKSVDVIPLIKAMDARLEKIEELLTKVAELVAAPRTSEAVSDFRTTSTPVV